MKVFLSWSGPRSKKAALAFRDFLSEVIQTVEPWMSDVDIRKGAQWFHEISREMTAATVGIVFLTRENLEKPWLHFEAGALAKGLEQVGGAVPLVATYLLGLEPADVEGPLSAFNHTVANRDDTLKLLKSINTAVQAKGERALSEALLMKVFEKSWPELEEMLNELLASEETTEPERDIVSMVEEILEYVRPRPQEQQLKERVLAALKVTSTLQTQFAAAMDQHHQLHAELRKREATLASMRAMKAQAAARIESAKDGDERALAEVDHERAARSGAAAEDELESLRARFVQSEARLITLREELAQARSLANLGVA